MPAPTREARRAESGCCGGVWDPIDVYSWGIKSVLSGWGIRTNPGRTDGEWQGHGTQKLDEEAQRPEVWTERTDKDLRSGHRGLHLES